MNLLNNDLKWLLTEMLPDGPLAVLCNESSTFNRFCYFNKEYSIKIQDELKHRYIYNFYTLEYFNKIRILDGPNTLKYVKLFGYTLTDKEAMTLSKKYIIELYVSIERDEDDYIFSNDLINYVKENINSINFENVDYIILQHFNNEIKELFPNRISSINETKDYEIVNKILDLIWYIDGPGTLKYDLHNKKILKRDVNAPDGTELLNTLNDIINDTIETHENMYNMSVSVIYNSGIKIINTYFN